MSIIRSATIADTPAIIDLAIATEMFLPNEVEPLQEILDNFHGELSEERLELWIENPSDPPIEVVYFVPNHMSDRTWELLMIAVTPERQRSGIGGKMLLFAEESVRASNGRILFINTSSLSQYDATRKFYSKYGYEEVARIPDFYKDGDSKVTFAKRIVPKNL
jgi:ribosomal protein S18 acetylase RimI-like enzyme